jgi:hypothetical protein
MEIKNAKYVADLSGENNTIEATIDGVHSTVPLDPANSHYAEIMRQVEAGDLTIAAAD